MRPIFRLLASSLLLLALPVSAAQVSGLYEVRQPVTSQADQERIEAMGLALQHLAVRLTGNPQAGSDERLQALLSNPQALVARYVYEAGKPLDLLMSFEPELLSRALSDAGLTLWNPDRPLVLTWWLSNTAAGTYLVADTGDAGRADGLRDAARRRGLPLALPLGDLSEQGLGVRDLLATDGRQLAELSSRYSADVRLAVVERVTATGYKADWVLWLADQVLEGQVEAAQTPALADAVFLAVAEKLSSQFTGEVGSQQTLLLEVDNVDLERHATLQRLLAPFKARLLQVDGQRQRYVLQTSPAQLRAQLALGRMEEVAADAEAGIDAQGTPVLHFH